MNLEKMTNKTREALNGARQIALEYHHTELKNLHVLAAMLQDENGLTNSILSRLGISRNLFAQRVNDALQKLPQAHGQQEIYNSSEVLSLLSDAARQAENMQDEYISVEHLLLAMFQSRNEAALLLEQGGINSDKLLNALQSIRGNQRVTGVDPESTFEALKKYINELKR